MTIESINKNESFFCDFYKLYKQLSSPKYPKTSKILANPDNRLHQYLNKIKTNQLDEKLFFEITQVNKLLPLINSPKVNISDQQLSELIKGRLYRFDEKCNDRPRNLFFEADFALRFVKSSNDFKKVDLNYNKIEDECDIVVNDTIIVECKSINSEKKIRDRILEANAQLTIRLQHLTTDAAGIIAIDISQIIQATNTDAFFKELIQILNKNKLIHKLRDNTSDPEAIKTIYENCNRFFDNQLEKLNITNDTLKNLELSQDIYSVAIQSEIITIIDIKNMRDNSLEIIPIFGRIMTPFKNPLYKGKNKFPSNFHKSLQHEF